MSIVDFSLQSAIVNQQSSISRVRSPSFYALQLWSECYRLQDIQLSKIQWRGPLHPAKLTRSWGPYAPRRSFASPAGALRPVKLLGFSDGVFQGVRRAEILKSPILKSPNFKERGGEYRARTGDLLVANQALSQLS